MANRLELLRNTGILEYAVYHIGTTPQFVRTETFFFWNNSIYKLYLFIVNDYPLVIVGAAVVLLEGLGAAVVLYYTFL